MLRAIDTFLPSWQHARGLTTDFIRAVPEERWDWSPHPRYATLPKQFRHLVCVQGVYLDGLRQGVASFAAKHSHYGGPLERQALLDALQDMDEQLERTLRAIPAESEDDFEVEFYGRQKLRTYLNTFLYHEALHQGQWSFYASLGGFETPRSWQLNWGL